MASLNNSYSTVVTAEIWDSAMKMAQKRIATAYKRDARLNEEERIEKIAIGYVGEFAFIEYCKSQNITIIYLGQDVSNVPDDGDFLAPDSQKTIDVKTQEIFYLPKEDWRCEVTSDQIKRPIDVYVFAKMYTSKISEKKNITVGWLSKAQFLEIAELRPAGSYFGERKVHYSKYDVLISQLNNLQDLKTYLNAK